MTGQGFDLPWFPLWATDFTDSRTVRNMTPEEVGVYVLLLCDQWKEGSVPDDPDEWRGITNHADTNTVEAVLERCFNRGSSGWVNERLEEVREEQVEKRMQKVRAGKASAEARRRKAKSKRGKDKERRSNGVATEDQRRTNEPESESDTESDTEVEVIQTKDTPSPDADVGEGPHLWMHDIWHDELGIDGHRIKLTAKRRKKYQSMYDEHLAEAKSPEDAWRAVLRCVQQSDHHMSVRRYQFPESLLRNEERREQWVEDTIQAMSNGGGTKASRRLKRNAKSMERHLRERRERNRG